MLSRKRHLFLLERWGELRKLFKSGKIQSRYFDVYFLLTLYRAVIFLSTKPTVSLETIPFIMSHLYQLRNTVLGIPRQSIFEID